MPKGKALMRPAPQAEPTTVTTPGPEVRQGDRLHVANASYVFGVWEVVSIGREVEAVGGPRTGRAAAVAGDQAQRPHGAAPGAHRAVG